MHITLEQKAGTHERYAPDIQLPEPGSKIRIREGGQATLISASRVDDRTLRITLDVPEHYGDLLHQSLADFSL